MGVSAMHKHVLKVVLPRQREEIYWHPITAGEIMSKYPRHCIARPDVFQYPWIVVRPESLLLPGQVFYLVPYSTLDKLLKAKGQQSQPLVSSEQNPSLRISLNAIRQNSPTKSLAGVTPKHREDVHNSEEYYYEGTGEQDYSTGTSYRTEFYVSWNEARKSLDDGYDHRSCSVLDSPLDNTGRSCFSILRSVRPQQITSHEHVELPRPMPKSCLRKPDSKRKNMNLVVSFASPVVVPGSRRGSPSVHHNHLQLQW